jgi:hypothetical protein
MPSDESRADAEYFASMCSELADLADRSGFDLGAYLLKMASLEFAKHLAPAAPSALQQQSTTVHLPQRSRACH